MAKYIKADGTETEVSPKNGKDFTLEELQGFVSGYIEIIRTNLPYQVMVINEEGKIDDLPLNEKATALTSAIGMAEDDFIVGDVVVCKESEIK